VSDKVKSIPIESADLIATLTQASLTETFATSDRVVESLTLQRDEAVATVAAVRSRVCELLAGDYMPTPFAIERALWPSLAVVDEFKREARS
jgi:hypothetical protein